MFFVSIFVAVFCVFLFCIYDIITPYKYPIGPTRFPLIGNYFEIRKLRNELGFYHLVWDQLAKCYGQVYSIKLGRLEAIIVSGYDAVRHVLCKDDFDGRQDGFFFRARAFNKKLGLAYLDGPMWVEQKKFIMQHLRKIGFGGDLMERVISEEVNDLILDITRRSKNGKQIQIHGLFDVTVLNGLWAMLAGRRFVLNDPKLVMLMELVHHTFKSMDSTGGILNQMPFLRFLAPRFSGYVYMQDILNEFYTFLKESIEEHKNNLDQENLICAFLMEIEKNKKSPKLFSEEQLLVVLFDLFVGGSENTTSTISFVILLFLKHEDVQAKVRKEIDTVIGDREVHFTDRHKLNYLEAVLMEVQRHYTVAPLAIPHRSIRKSSIQGYIIPKDTIVFPSIWSIHMDVEHWGDPEVFRPDRFLDDTGKIKNDSWLMPFGVGRRRCPGEILAKTNVFLVITKLIQNFEIRIPQGAQLPDKAQDGIGISPSPFSAIFIPRRLDVIS